MIGGGGVIPSMLGMLGPAFRPLQPVSERFSGIQVEDSQDPLERNRDAFTVTSACKHPGIMGFTANNTNMSIPLVLPRWENI